MNCNTTHYRANSSSVPGDPTLTRRTTSGSGVINDAPLLWLFVTGAVLVAATLIYYGATATGGRPDQTYTPPRMKDGQIEPGQIK